MATKKKNNPKQMNGVKSTEPFVKTRKKATTKVKETARIELVCFSNDEVDVMVDGDAQHLIAALAGLLTDHDERNTFGTLVKTAIELIVFKDITAEA